MQVRNSIYCSGGLQQIASVQVDDDDVWKAVCSLNLRQCKTFNIVCHWARSKLKQMNSIFKNVVESLHEFIIGGAGVGKSHLVKILTFFFFKLLIYIDEHQIKKSITSCSSWCSCIEYWWYNYAFGVRNKSRL